MVAGAVLLVAGAPSCLALFVAEAIGAPASGGFVSLSQASLMDLDAPHRERNMARWMVAGSIGGLAGPLLLGVVVAVGFGWRWAFAVLAVVSLPLVVLAHRAHAPDGHGSRDERAISWRAMARGLRAAIADREVLRWLAALELGDLLGDVLLSFLALYLVDAAGASQAQGGIAVAVWSAAGLVGGLVLVKATERVDGLRLLRIGAVVALVSYPTFLLVPVPVAKTVVVAVIGVVTASWYPVAQARLFATLDGRSGLAVAVSALSAPVGLARPLIVAAIASAFGIEVAMWLLMIGPVAMLLLVPRSSVSPSHR